MLWNCGPGWAWDALAQRPILNLLLALYAVCFDQLWLAIIAWTALVRLALLPASARQVQQSWLLANRERWAAELKRLLRENMRLYRGAGGSPVGALVSVIAQLLALGALYLSLRQLFYRPTESAGAVYPWLPFLSAPGLFPLDFGFLWLNLSESDPTVLVLPLLAAATTWGVMRQSPGMMTQTGWSRRLMLWAFPALVGVVFTGLPSGIALYQTVANAISIGVHWALLRRMLAPALSYPAAAGGPARRRCCWLIQPARRRGKAGAFRSSPSVCRPVRRGCGRQ